MLSERESARLSYADWLIQARNLLNELGAGLISASAYDTAWVSRLITQDEQLGKEALEWLSANQLPDGSWGTESPICYQDRVICTLSAMTALAQFGRRAHDRTMIKNGQAALDALTQDMTRRLMANPAGSTVGFEMIAPMLVTEALQLGVMIGQGNRILGRLEQQRKLKLAKLAGRKIDRTITAAFSVEMVGKDLGKIDIDLLQEANGSIAYSPSATAFYLLNVDPCNAAGLDYLKRVKVDGAVPYVGPLDVFECAWSLWNLALVDSKDELHDLTKAHIQTIRNAWKPGIGAATATGLSLVDGDDTAVAFEAMLHWGHTADIEALLSYEAEKNFLCFRLEVDPSTSTNIHLLSAFKSAGYDREHPAVRKIRKFLLSNRLPDLMWVDKWHLSPYYPSAHAIIACAGYDDEMVEGCVRQILAAQNADGSWGYLQKTAEETAYALQALCVWKKTGHQVNDEVLRQGAAWLMQHDNEPYPNLWVGKCLYCPIRVVKSSILSAVGMVIQELKGAI